MKIEIDTDVDIGDDVAFRSGHRAMRGRVVGIQVEYSYRNEDKPIITCRVVRDGKRGSYWPSADSVDVLYKGTAADCFPEAPHADR